MAATTLEGIKAFQLERIADSLDRIAIVLESYMAKMAEQEAHWKELNAIITDDK